MRRGRVLVGCLLALGGCSGGGGDSGSGEPGSCPPEMAPVPAGDPVYCIDRYEAAEVDGVAISEAGRVPTDQVSFDEARAICAATPVVDEEGQTHGFKHLATSQEWEDAADGVPGEGGRAFPYGETWDPALCASTSEAGDPVYDETQPAGAFPDCVSPFGVYDQQGNLWEWMDAQTDVDATTALERMAAAGAPVEEQADGSLTVSGLLHMLRLHMLGVEPGDVYEVDGRIFVPRANIQVFEASRGFLAVGTDLPRAGWYPVQLEQVEDGAWVNMNPDGDGTAITDKRGCAWYTGHGEGCNVHYPNYLHPHDFLGTVGFRCAAEPW